MLVLKDKWLEDMKGVKASELLLYYRYRVQLSTTGQNTTQAMSHDRSCAKRQINQATVVLKSRDVGRMIGFGRIDSLV